MMQSAEEQASSKNRTLPQPLVARKTLPTPRALGLAPGFHTLRVHQAGYEPSLFHDTVYPQSTLISHNYFAKFQVKELHLETIKLEYL